MTHSPEPPDTPLNYAQPVAPPAAADPSVPSAPLSYADPGRVPTARLRPEDPNPGAWVVAAMGWIILGCGLVVGSGLIIALVWRMPPLSAVGAAVGLLVLICLARATQEARRARATTVLGYLHQAVRLNLPLPAMLRAAARGERPRVRKDLDRVRDRLEDGYPVADSLRLALSGVPVRTLHLVAAAERSARLPAALRRLADRERTQGRRGDLSAPVLLRWYVLLLIVGVFGGVIMYTIFVLPKFIQILRDFHLPVPAFMLWLRDSGDWLAPVGVSVIGLVFVWQVGRTAGELVSPRLVRHNPLRALTDRLAWHVPVVRGIVRHRALADVCHVLADALESGRTLHAAVYEAGDLQTNAVLRKRVYQWEASIRGGSDAAAAARAAGLPPLLVGMLASARGGPGGPGAAGDLPRVLHFVGDYYESRFSRAAAVARAMVAPALAVFFGLLVGMLALAIFKPMVDLANHLASEPVPGGRM